MKLKLWRCAAAFLPVCFLSAQQPDPQTSQQPQPEVQSQPVPGGSHGPSPEAMRQIAERWRLMREHANAINDLAGHIQSPDDARKLVDLVADEFSKELPPRWATRSIRSRIVHAEYETAYDPGTLIPEQHVADAWNDFLQKISAPPETYVTAAEIHTLRDTYYVTSQLSWARNNQNIWTVPNIYAIGPDGKVANGCRAIEVLNILWQLANQPEALESTRNLIATNHRFSDDFKNPSKPPAPGSEKSYMTVQVVRMPPNPIEQAAQRYMHDHGVRAFNKTIEGLLQDLFAS